MGRHRRQKPIQVENIAIESVAAEGKAIARHDGKVVFIPFAAPGDIADIEIQKSKKSFALGKITQLKKESTERIQPLCEHFGTCGGCKWQHLNYPYQVDFKSRQLMDDIQRIGKVEDFEILSPLSAEEAFEYRNKVEFTFSNKAWEEHFDKENPKGLQGLGFHIPGMFDKVLDIEHCHLIPEIGNRIKNAVKQAAIDAKISFFDIRQQSGVLRNLMLRRNSKNEWMLLLAVSENENQSTEKLFDSLISDFPEVKEWCYVINNKKNDIWSDLPVHIHKGNGYLTEEMHGLEFQIRPQSFFQTNYKQALRLYSQALEFADLKGNENVYDLYTGTGTIALFLAKKAAFVTGIEYVEAAIVDAKENAKHNGLNNVAFYAGDMKNVLNEDLFKKHGKPDVIVTDPPRDGMHPDVIQAIIQAGPDRISYVSCNPATLSRDIALLSSHYELKKAVAVDMFPQTHHVEAVALLIKKSK